MEIQLESLEYQETAIKSVVDVFDGNVKNSFDNACRDEDGIRSNICTLSDKILRENIKSVIHKNGIDAEVAKLINEKKLTIEMETNCWNNILKIKKLN